MKFEFKRIKTFYSASQPKICSTTDIFACLSVASRSLSKDRVAENGATSEISSVITKVVLLLKAVAGNVDINMANLSLSAVIEMLSAPQIVDAKFAI